VTLFVTGLSHRNAPVSVREQIAVEEDKLREILGDVQASGVAAEIVVLSTCNRVEVYGVAEVAGEARGAIFRHLCRQRGVPIAAVEPVLYTLEDAEAIRHAFRVASSLDSMMIGEPQILGQVKDAFALAQACETVGPTLHTLFTHAFAVAKKVRSETEIARHAVSVSFAAVELAKKIFAGLTGRAVLLVGAGKMGELAAKHLVEQGAFPIYVTNRTWSRAQEIARALAGTAVPFDELTSAMSAVDIVITSTGASAPLVTRPMVQGLMQGRRRPLFFIDIAVPRNVETSVNTLDNVYVYDIDDLNNVIETNLEERQREASLAEEIVVAEVAGFRRWLDSQQVTPTIVSLRRKFDDVRHAEVAKALSALGTADPKTRKVVESLAAAILNKVLHSPIASLKRETDGRSPMEMVTAVREIFDLPEVEADGAPEALVRPPEQGGNVGSQ
jgi:glutamyl-tRNA reductase